MCQLHRVEKNDHLLCIFNLSSRSTGGFECFRLPLPDLLLALEVVTSITKTADGVNIKRILSLADDSLALDRRGVMDFVVDLLGVVC